MKNKDLILHQTETYNLVVSNISDEAEGNLVYKVINHSTMVTEAQTYIYSQAIDYMLTMEKALRLSLQDLKEYEAATYPVIDEFNPS